MEFSVSDLHELEEISFRNLCNFYKRELLAIWQGKMVDKRVRGRLGRAGAVIRVGVKIVLAPRTEAILNQVLAEEEANK